MTIQGSIVAIITPMRLDGSINYCALEKLLDWHITEGTHGIVVAGTTGESSTLDVTEHREVIRHTVQYVSGRVQVIAGTGANSTAEAIALTSNAKKDGADACLLVVPYYNRPCQEGLFQHFKTIAKEVEIDQLLYNVPSRTSCDMLPETVARLAELDNIVGIKDATGDMERMKAHQALLSGNAFSLLTGDDSTAYEFMTLGGHGGISVSANVAPKLSSQMYQAALDGDFELAKQIDDRLQPLHRDLFCEPNPTPVKWLVSQMGFCLSTVRLPLVELSLEGQSKVRDAFKSLG